MVILLALLGLGCRDTAFSRYEQALRVWDEGRAAYERGEHAAAAEAFARLGELDPDSPAAPAWRAWALDRAGDPEGALAALDEALKRFPDDATLRYNRAALRARQGQVARAAEDLRVLYAAGAVEPVDVGMDPDFAAVAADPATAALAPPPAVELALRGEEGAVLLGDRASLELEITALEGRPVSITDMSAPSGLLRHLRTVEDIQPPEGRLVHRTLSTTWRAVAAGEATLGPWLVAAGGVSAVSERVPLTVLAMPGRAAGGEADEEGALRSVEALFAGHEAPWAGRDANGVLVLLPPGGRAQVRGADGSADPEPVQLELRRAGQTEAQGELHRVSAEATVEITRSGQVVLATRVPAGSG